MKLKSLLFLVASLASMLAFACSEVVFPTPLPTATPAPTATPIVFPTPLPTATPFALPSPLPAATPAVVVFPTPLPTATPITLPSPVPTATPAVVVFPTPLPTATPITLPSPVPVSTPVPTATPIVFPSPLPTSTPAPTATPPFASISNVEVVSLRRRATNGDLTSGIGSVFVTDVDRCAAPWVCILTAAHFSGYEGEESVFDTQIGVGEYAFLSDGVSDSSRLTDLAVIRTKSPHLSGLTPFALAPYDASVRPSVRPGDAIRVVVMDWYRISGTTTTFVEQRLEDGIVSRVGADDFSVTGQFSEGHKGGVVLNSDMQVIGIVKHSLTNLGIAIDVDLIRLQLCIWRYLVGTACPSD